MKTIKLFLASSSELKEEREQFEIFIYRKTKDWLPRFDIFLHLDIWEDFIDAMSMTRLQDEYNKAVKGCDIFILLAWNKVGKYTAEEFEKAFGRFQETAKPFIYTYFKTPDASATPKDLQSLEAFEARLKALGHYKTPFENIEGLKFHFSGQLDKLLGNGFMKVDKPREADYSAPAIYINNSKNVVTGNVDTGGGDFIVGDGNRKVTQYHSGSGHNIAGDNKN